MSIRQQEGVIKDLEEEVNRLEGVVEVIRGKARECMEKQQGEGDGDAMEVS